jgi:GntR family transcriptional repressor for pyruvate dehydrogenase complex
MTNELRKAKLSGPKIRPINKTTISDEIVEQIMRLIERGDLQPGQRLPSERELCVQFGTGRSSLREALRCLSIVGVLHARVGEGTSVAVDSGKFLGTILQWRLVTEQRDIKNLMEVRIALEGVTAASVARNWTEEDLLPLDELIEEMGTVVNDRKKFTNLDLEFHLHLAKVSGNSLVMDLISMIRGQLARALSRVLTLPNARPLSLEEHIQIMQKIRERDPEGAREAMSHHLQAVVSRYQRGLGSENLEAPTEKVSVPKHTAGRKAPTKRKAAAK